MYLIRQVAASDATDRGRPSLADYYSAKGEAPGTWMGRGLAALGKPVYRDAADRLVTELWGVPHGSQVSEDQMKALFGEGLHPNADRITRHLTGVGVGQAGAMAAARLGRPFPINDKENRFVTRLREAYRDYNTTVGNFLHIQLIAVLFFAAMVPIAGALADRFGRRRTLLVITSAIIVYGASFGPMLAPHSATKASVLLFL